MNIILRLSKILCFSLIATSSAFGQSYEVGTLNSEMQIPITASSPDELNYIFRGINKLKQNFELQIIEAPSGLKISMVGGMVEKGNSELLGIFTSTLVPAKLFFGNNIGSFEYIVDGNSGGGSSETRDPTCGCLTDEQINYFIDIYNSYGANYNRASFCAMVGSAPGGGSCESVPDYGTPPTSDDSLIKAFIQRNQCGKQDHFANVKFDLSGVDKSAGPIIRIIAKFKPYKGKKASSIKPLGEGMYPQPLFLGSVISGNYYANQHTVKLSRWNGVSRTSAKNIDVADFIYYPPVGALIRVPLEKSLLSGGKGTFEVSSKGVGYSMCATLKAKRQYFFGYTN